MAIYKYYSDSPSLRHPAKSEMGKQEDNIIENISSSRQTGQRISEASLLGLPVEIRRLIFAYLLPLTKIASGTSHYDKWEPLECAAGPCNLSIVQTNRQLYRESIDLFYKSTTFSAWVAENNIRFVNRDWIAASTLPFGFRFITNLSLTVKAAGRPRNDFASTFARRNEYSWSKGPSHHRRLVKRLANIFSSEGPGNLQSLDLTIYTGSEFWFPVVVLQETGKYEDIPDPRRRVHECLEFNFDSLRSIKTSCYVRVKELSERYSLTYLSGDNLKEVMAVKKEYFKSLVKDISRGDESAITQGILSTPLEKYSCMQTTWSHC